MHRHTQLHAGIVVVLIVMTFVLKLNLIIIATIVVGKVAVLRGVIVIEKCNKKWHSVLCKIT